MTRAHCPDLSPHCGSSSYRCVSIHPRPDALTPRIPARSQGWVGVWPGGARSLVWAPGFLDPQMGSCEGGVTATLRTGVTRRCLHPGSARGSRLLTRPWARALACGLWSLRPPGWASLGAIWRLCPMTECPERAGRKLVSEDVKSHTPPTQRHEWGARAAGRGGGQPGRAVTAACVTGAAGPSRALLHSGLTRAAGD